VVANDEEDEEAKECNVWQNAKHLTRESKYNKMTRELKERYNIYGYTT